MSLVIGATWVSLLGLAYSPRLMSVTQAYPAGPTMTQAGTHGWHA